MWKIELGKQADKFVKKENITDDELLAAMQKFVNHSAGLDVNIGVKKLRGKWKGYHRIRIGKIRMLLRVNFKERTISINKMDYRGDVYKRLAYHKSTASDQLLGQPLVAGLAGSGPVNEWSTGCI